MLLLFTFISTVLAGKILIYNPTIGVSHVRFLGNLADLYIADGHEVTILSPVVDDHVDPIGTSNLKVKKIVYHSKYVNVEDWKTMDIKRPEFWTTPAPRGMSMSWDVWRCFINTTSNIYKGLLEDKKMLNYLIDQKFDLGVLETFELGGIGLFEILGIKANIVAAALGLIGHHYPLTGIPYFSSFVPDFLSSMDGEMTFVERLINLRTTIQLHFQLDEDVEILHRIFRKHYPNFPNIRELYQKRSAVVFTNTNEFTESPRLKTNMIQYVGGTNVRPPKPLSKELDEILELRESTVFVSFGSFVQACTMPLEMKIEILESFSRYPDVTFLWKYESHCENDSIPLKDYPNVITKDWWPQTDLLGDARVKGFITHAGMNSLLEAAFRGKPLITIPLFADQYINAKNSARLGLAVMISRTDISRSHLIPALHQLLKHDSAVAKKASLAADVLKGRDEEYRQAALHWARLLCKYGPMDHLQLPTLKLNFFQVYSLDCLGFVLLVFSLLILVVYYLMRCFKNVLHKFARTRKSQKKE